MEAGYRTPRRAARRRRRRRGRFAAWLVLFALPAAAFVWLVADGLFGTARDGARQAAGGLPADVAQTAGRGDVAPPDGQAETGPGPAKRTIVDFRMADLDAGWYIFDDGTVMVTEDGGLTWREAGPDWTMPEGDGLASALTEGRTASGAGDADAEAPGGAEAGVGVTSGAGEAAHAGDAGVPGTGGREADERAAFLEALRKIEAAHLDFDASRPIVIDGRTIRAKRVQPVSGRIGWALADEDSGLDHPLLVSVDGGLTWHSEVTPEVAAAIREERERRRLRAEEAALYADPLAVMMPGSGTVLFPGVTYPGDAVLVRSEEPGAVEWQGKTYELKPYKTGHFTYLPVPRSTKPGTYTVGGARLEVKAKTFSTQHLTVSEEMEAMRRNTERIEADQKKVNEARSRSAETFLFDSPFLKPIEGRLSTPYGYTRYINGKLSSTHNAIDLAAPEGTPIAATNDGVVVLAEELYLTGLTIYIDHGMGLFSQYAHLSELHVSAGDTVKKGDVIGLVGSTGFSTGPHLHFTFWVHNTPANPDLFFDTTPFRWENP